MMSNNSRDYPSRERSMESAKKHSRRKHDSDDYHLRSPSSSKHRSKERSERTSKHKKSKHKKKKKHSSSSDSSSSADSELEELKLLQRLEAEKIRLKEERRKQKELAKANETPEEKRARRLREKQDKERKRRERMGWDGEYQCYTDQDNPFGDSALTNTFVWSKKLAKEGIKNISREELEAQNRQKQMENKVELEKVKARRLVREQARLEAERSLSEAAKAREAQHFSSWNKQEDAFQLQQAKLRSHIRIRDGRAKPIDLLAWYVSSERSVDALEMHEPYSYLNGLQTQDLEDLQEDIKVYMQLQSDDASAEAYWRDVLTIVKDELSKVKTSLSERITRDPVHDTVAQDVAEIFKGKSTSQLEALEKQISLKISGKQDGVDIGYWESLLSQLKAHMCKARLRARHQNNLRVKLQLLKEEQGLHQSSSATETNRREPSPEEQERDSEEKETKEEKEISCDEEKSKEMYASGNYSPKLIKGESLEGITLVEEQEEIQRLMFLRKTLTNKHTDTQQKAEPVSSCPMLAEARKGLTEEESVFSGETTLLPKHYVWADKYRPRKPRYFNRVHTGFEWNKYNQTHYDIDNPPPKIVQGYKFNIFYPDLIDPHATPQFSLKPCSDNSEFAILRFEAGPPYEDIAFKIVNREWEYSYKRGFRCHFHNNIFQLWFHFKRYRYRR